MCQSWFYSTCQDLKTSDVVFITKLAAKGVEWFCTECAQEIQGQSTTVVPQVTKLNHLEKMIGNLGEKIDEYQRQSGSQIECMKSSWAEVTSDGQMAKDVKLAMKTKASTNAMLAAELDKKDTEERKNNAILYGLQENSTAMDDVADLMQKTLFKDFDKPVKAFRLSKKEEGKIRPLKRTFRDEEARWNFVKRANHSLRSDGMFCKLDVNKKTRDIEFQLREQLRGLRKEDTNSTEYRIRNLSIKKII